jgi:hypothetical protein
MADVKRPNPATVLGVDNRCVSRETKDVADDGQCVGFNRPVRPVAAVA